MDQHNGAPAITRATADITPDRAAARRLLMVNYDVQVTRRVAGASRSCPWECKSCRIVQSTCAVIWYRGARRIDQDFEEHCTCCVANHIRILVQHTNGVACRPSAPPPLSPSLATQCPMYCVWHNNNMLCLAVAFCNTLDTDSTARISLSLAVSVCCACVSSSIFTLKELLVTMQQIQIPYRLFPPI